MKFKDFKDKVNSYTGHDEDVVIIKLDNISFGPVASAYVNNITPGFDWDKGAMIIKSEQSIIYNPDVEESENDNWKNKTVKVQDVLDMCEKAADVNHELAEKIITNEKSDVTVLAAYAWFIQEERKYRYDIPEIIREVADDTLKDGEQE
jgi:hypothetical protein